MRKLALSISVFACVVIPTPAMLHAQSGSGAAQQVEESPSEEFSDTQEQALEGSSSAQLALGHYYREGYGTEADLNEARFWYITSGLIRWSGHAYALRLAGDVSLELDDYGDAVMLYHLARLAGGSVESDKIEAAEGRLSSHELEQAIQEAQRLANQFRFGETQGDE